MRAKCVGARAARTTRRARGRTSPRHGTIDALGVLDAVDDDTVAARGGRSRSGLRSGRRAFSWRDYRRRDRRSRSARAKARPLWSNIWLPSGPRIAGALLVQASSQVEQARQRLLRHPRPRARQGAPDGGRGPAHHQAQHRQHRRVRARAARRDRAGHDPQPAERGRLHRFQGPVRAAQGDRPLHPAKARQGRDRRRRLPRQRRLRADHDEHERPAQRRRRGADPGARLSAVDRLGRAVGRNAGPLPLRRGRPTGCPTSTTWPAKITPRTRAIVVINPNNPTGALYPDALLRRDRRARAQARADRLRRRDLRQDALRRPHPHLDRLARRRRALPHLQRPVEELPLVRLPRRLDGRLGREAPRAPTTSRG